MRAVCGLGGLALALAGACTDFHGADPGPETSDGGTDAGVADAGVAADAVAAAADAAPARSGIVVRGIVQTESPSGVQVQLPFGIQAGDLLWATVFVRPLGSVDNCKPSTGWTPKRRASTVACSTVYSGAIHLFRVATDAEPAVQSPCVLDAQSASSASAVVVAAFGGVDPDLPFEDFEASNIPIGGPAQSTLTAPEATAATDAAESFVVFVDPDGHNDSGWAKPDGMTKGAVTINLALFHAPVGRAGAVPARVTHKAAGEDFCSTAEASTVVLHPKP